MRTVSRERRREAFLGMSMKLFDEMEAWYERHPEATFAELELRLRERRREVMGELLGILVEGREQSLVREAPPCPQCGSGMEFHEYRERTIHGLEGETRFKRAYYRCPLGCRQGIFPPRPETGLGQRQQVE